ncbi:hypothetical protein [Streptomyces sp. NBC_00388]|uniref:hypothetical protein n=1 Tax=Streptomyces sp. NBC_00388 TaxID=2975735 RepID=UPI002E1C4D7D
MSNVCSLCFKYLKSSASLRTPSFLEPVQERQGPGEWLPTDHSYRCAYATTWVATKLRWDLAADTAEGQALLGLAVDCPNTNVVYEPAS